MMWLLIVANLATGEIDSYEMSDRRACTVAADMIDGGTVRAWCIPERNLIAVEVAQ